MAVRIMKVEVRFFASVRDRMGVDSLSVETEEGSLVRDLWRKTSGDDPDARVLAAVNARHAPMDQPLADGDVVAFFPPVTGG